MRHEVNGGLYAPFLLRPQVSESGGHWSLDIPHLLLLVGLS